MYPPGFAFTILFIASITSEELPVPNVNSRFAPEFNSMKNVVASNGLIYFMLS